MGEQATCVFLGVVFNREMVRGVLRSILVKAFFIMILTAWST